MEAEKPRKEEGAGAIRAPAPAIAMHPLWVIRILFLFLCTLGGYSISQVRPEWVANGLLGAIIGFGLGGLCVAVDEMLKGFSLRAFSAATS